MKIYSVIAGGFCLFVFGGLFCFVVVVDRTLGCLDGLKSLCGQEES